MDDRANWSQWTSWLFRLEGEMRYQGRSHQQSLKQSDIPPVCFSGSAILLSAQRVPADHKGAARGDAEAAHLHGVPQLLPLDPRPHRQRVQLQVNALLASPRQPDSLSHSTINAWNSSSSPLKETFSLWTMNQSKLQPHQSRMPPRVALSLLCLSPLSLYHFSTFHGSEMIASQSQARERLVSASWNPPSTPNVHILVSAVRMLHQPAPSTYPSHFLRPVLLSHWSAAHYLASHWL